MKFLLMPIILLFSIVAQAWDLNDVTYIYPLPNASNDYWHVHAGDANMLPQNWFTDSSAGGRFDAAFTADPLETATQFSIAYLSMTLVAFRIDPCFRDLFTDDCKKQIRAVWQPIDHDQYGRAGAVDSSVHTFYTFNDAEFLAMVLDLKSIVKKNGVVTKGLPLGIHPGLRSDHDQFKFKSDLRGFVLKWLDRKRMSRVAFNELQANATQWRLTNYEIEKGVATIRNIPLSNLIEQVVTNQLSGTENEGIDLANQPEMFTTSATQLNNFDSESLSLDNVEGWRSAANIAARIESPESHLPGTIDCLSCHVASAVKTLANSYLYKNKSPLIVDFFAPKGSYNMANQSTKVGSVHNFRMLGYFHLDLQIGDRLINETASVADQLSQQYP